MLSFSWKRWLFNLAILYCNLSFSFESSILQFGKKYGRPFWIVRSLPLSIIIFPIWLTLILSIINSLTIFFSVFSFLTVIQSLLDIKKTCFFFSRFDLNFTISNEFIMSDSKYPKILYESINWTDWTIKKYCKLGI